jgi:DUF3102 family protein
MTYSKTLRSTSTPTAGDKPTLNTLAANIRAGLADIDNHMRSALRTALDIGRALRVARTEVLHGQWAGWLKSKCGIPQVRTAQLYIQLEENRPMIEAHLATNPDLSIRKARQLITLSKGLLSALTDRPTGQMCNAVTHLKFPKPNLLDRWERASEREQKAILDAMPRERLLAILPDGFGLVSASTRPKSAFAAIPLPEGDDGLGIPTFLDRKHMGRASADSTSDIKSAA